MQGTQNTINQKASPDAPAINADLKSLQTPTSAKYNRYILQFATYNTIIITV